MVYLIDKIEFYPVFGHRAEREIAWMPTTLRCMQGVVSSRFSRQIKRLDPITNQLHFKAIVGAFALYQVV